MSSTARMWRPFVPEGGFAGERREGRVRFDWLTEGKIRDGVAGEMKDEVWSGVRRGVGGERGGRVRGLVLSISILGPSGEVASSDFGDTEASGSPCGGNP